MASSFFYRNYFLLLNRNKCFYILGGRNMKIKVAKVIEILIILIIIYGVAFVGDTVTGRDIFIWTVGLVGGYLTNKYIKSES